MRKLGFIDKEGKGRKEGWTGSGRGGEEGRKRGRKEKAKGSWFGAVRKPSKFLLMSGLKPSEQHSVTYRSLFRTSGHYLSLLIPQKAG